MLYRTGVIIGGFQPLHIGHEDLINTALNLCDYLYIYIGQRKNGSENVFSFNTRKELILTVFKNYTNRIKIFKNEYRSKELWCNYILQLFKETIGHNPNIIIHGDEDVRRQWFPQIQRNFNELFIPRRSPVDGYRINGTNVRKALLNNNKQLFNMCMNPKLHNQFERLKAEIY